MGRDFAGWRYLVRGPAARHSGADRIGDTRSRVGGLLYGVLKGFEAEKCLHFGWATGALATTVLTDYALPADEDQVMSIWAGNARVKR